eukprot:6179292-Pleurochrysis_carterae.AAC.3
MVHGECGIARTRKTTRQHRKSFSTALDALSADRVRRWAAMGACARLLCLRSSAEERPSAGSGAHRKDSALRYRTEYEFLPIVRLPCRCTSCSGVATSSSRERQLRHDWKLRRISKAFREHFKAMAHLYADLPYDGNSRT